MKSSDLAGVTVLVTRPSGQADSLCSLIAARGGRYVALPAMNIVPQTPAPEAVAELRSATRDDLVVFVSRNAVRHGRAFLPGNDGPMIAAIGPSTVRDLSAGGLEIDIVPQGHDSESLLAQAELQDVSDRNIFIIRGEGGREKLAAALRQRGATVSYLEVYRRECPEPDTDELETVLAPWRQGGIDVYTATSVEVLRNLQAMLGQAGRDLLLATPMVTASRRVVKIATQLGHRGDRLLAPRPDDRSLVETIHAWREETAASPRDQRNESRNPPA